MCYDREELKKTQTAIEQEIKSKMNSGDVFSSQSQSSYQSSLTGYSLSQNNSHIISAPTPQPVHKSNTKSIQETSKYINSFIIYYSLNICR